MKPITSKRPLLTFEVGLASIACLLVINTKVSTPIRDGMLMSDP